MDSLEHYFFCPSLVHFARRSLGIRDDISGSPANFLLLERFQSENELIAMAYLVYAAYTAYHTLRHSPPLPLPRPSLPPPLLHVSDALCSRWLSIILVHSMR